MSSTIKQIRLNNFLKLLDEYRFDKEFGDKMSWSPAYISQIKGGSKGIGSANARRIEKTFNLNEGYMDIIHVSQIERRRGGDNSADDLATIIRRLPSHLRDHVTRLTYAIASEIHAQEDDDDNHTRQNNG